MSTIRGEVSVFMEEKDHPPEANTTGETKEREVDLNALFPGKGYDLNRLFPDEGTKKLLHDLKRNKRDIERFIRNLESEED
jgi:hypothetical protein